MSIRIEVNRAGAKALQSSRRTERGVQTLNIDRYETKVNLVNASTVQIVLPSTTAGIRITMTSCDLMQIVRDTFEGTMQLVGGAAELSDALKKIVDRTVKSVDDETPDFEDEGSDDPSEDDEPSDEA